MLKFHAYTRSTKGLNYPHAFDLLGGGKATTAGINAFMSEVIYWTRDQFGPSDYLNGPPEAHRWRCDFRTIEFAREADATVFKLRWS